RRRRSPAEWQYQEVPCRTFCVVRDEKRRAVRRHAPRHGRAALRLVEEPLLSGPARILVEYRPGIATPLAEDNASAIRRPDRRRVVPPVQPGIEGEAQRRVTLEVEDPQIAGAVDFIPVHNCAAAIG